MDQAKADCAGEGGDETLMLIESISDEVPCYVLKFDKSGEVVEEFKWITK